MKKTVRGKKGIDITETEKKNKNCDWHYDRACNSLFYQIF